MFSKNVLLCITSMIFICVCKITIALPNTKRNTSARCPLPWDSRLTETLTSPAPRYSLDPDRYLLPVLTNGPNNQVIGLHESIFLAIHLNRTLVIPSFHKHRTDGQVTDSSKRNTTIHPGHRVNWKRLSRLIPIVTLDEFHENCESGQKVIFKTSSDLNLLKLERHTGLVFSADDQVLPTDNLDTFEDSNRYKISPLEVKAAYFSQVACAIFPWPFHSIQLSELHHFELSKNKGPTQKLSDSTELYLNVLRAVSLPTHVEKVAESFIRDVMGNGGAFITVHWRFDLFDWMFICQEHSVSKTREKMCTSRTKMEPEDFSAALLNYLKTVKGNVKNIYVASPLSEREFILKASKKIEESKLYKVFTSVDVESFLKAKYSNCDWLWEDYDDILSNVELSICTRGETFFRSITSSWSHNVKTWRDVKCGMDCLRKPAPDPQIFELVDDAVQQRLKNRRPEIHVV